MTVVLPVPGSGEFCMVDIKHIRLRLDDGCLKLFFPLLEKGVGIPIDGTLTAASFLMDRLGLSNDYIDKRVQTIFIDHRPVDDLNLARVSHTSVMALSAAMPGLLGATMRRGGHYAAFRKEISHAGDEKMEGAEKGRVTLKMFNLLLKEIGPGLFQMGVMAQWKELMQIFKKNKALLEAEKIEIALNQVDISMSRLLNLVSETDDVRLQIHSF